MNASMDQFRNPDHPDLQSVLDRALRDGLIPPPRVAGVRAAVACFARLMQRPAAELPAHQGFIILQMRRLRRQPTGLSPKTLSNTRSGLLYLVKTVVGRRPRSIFALSQEWADLRNTLSNDPAWWQLSRFAGFSSTQDVRPFSVDDAHMGRYLDALKQTGEVADPTCHTRRVITIWNKLAAAQPCLNLASLTLAPPKPKRWTLPEAEFPLNFRSDVDAWFGRLTNDDPFSTGPARALRPATIRTRRQQLFAAACALVFSGHPVDKVQSLADLVTTSAFQALLQFLLDRQDGKKTEALHGLAAGILAVARHHVHVDKVTEARLATIVKNLDVGAVGFRSKTRARLAAFEEDRHVSALLHLPAHLLEKAKSSLQPRRRKHLAQLAIAIEILSFAPMRVGNLVSIRLGENLRRITIGREKRWLITIPAEEVKNRTDLSYELPRETLIGEALSLYEQTGGYLFPGRASSPKVVSLLSGQIKRAVESHLGIPFHTHMFRALAGYLHLKENPNGFEAVRALLGNRDDNVIRNNYAFLAERSLISNAQASIGRTRARLVTPLRDKQKVV